MKDGINSPLELIRHEKYKEDYAKLDKFENLSEADEITELMPKGRVGLAKVNAERCRRAAELYEQASRLYAKADAIYAQARILERGISTSSLSEMLMG